MNKAMDMPAVWLSHLTDAELSSNDIYPPERQREIENTRNEKLKELRTLDWALLTALIESTTGRKIEGFNFRLSESGKWECDELYFSLSHAGNWVAAAISPAPIGVDIEDINEAQKRDWQLIKRKILTPREQEIHKNADWQALCRLWTRKESIFKRTGKGGFIPAQIEAEDEETQSFVVEGEIVLAVSGGYGLNKVYIWDGKGTKKLAF